MSVNLTFEFANAAAAAEFLKCITEPARTNANLDASNPNAVTAATLNIVPSNALSPLSVAAPAPRKPRAAKPVATTAAPATEAAPAPVTEAPAATATSPSEDNKAKKPTLDDVRAALVECQTRKGDKAVPLSILGKYAPTKTTGSLKAEDFAKVISECAAA